MSKLSQLAETLIGSEIVKLGNEINVRKSQGEKIFNYTIGDFDPSIFPIPKEYETAIIDAYKNGFTNYPPGDGVLALRQAVGDMFRKKAGIDYANNEIQITSGGRPVIYALFQTLIDEGDKVIYSVPSWNNNHYVHMTKGSHCTIPVTAENNFMPKASDIEPHISGARLICICTPQNPTGTTMDKTELTAICDLILAENAKRGENDKKLYLLFDQMYWTLTYGTVEHYNPVALRPEMKEFTIFVDGVSKSFSATGIRVGWTMGPVNVINKMKMLLTHVGAWAPMPEQVATANFLQNETAVENYMVDFKQKIQDRLSYIYNGFMNLKSKGFPVDSVAPQAAIYLTVKIDLKGLSFNGKIISTQQEVSDYILAAAKLAIVPFSSFGADKESAWYRISVGTCKMEELPEVFHQLEKALSQLS